MRPCTAAATAAAYARVGAAKAADAPTASMMDTAEAALLGSLVSCRHTIRKTRVRVAEGPEVVMSSIWVHPPGDDRRAGPDDPPIVMTGGVGAGAAMFYKNLDGLARRTGRRVIAVDWLGCGTSSRSPGFPRPRRLGGGPGDRGALAGAGLRFFLDSFEEWRIASGIRRFDLIGHSYGGFLSGHYTASRHGGAVRRLILMSSWGVPAMRPPAERGSGAGFSLRAPPVLSCIAGALLSLNLSPLSPVRAVNAVSTKSGSGLIRAAIRRRLGRAIGDGEEMRLVSDYIYAINVGGAGGVSSIEQSFSTFMVPAIDRWSSAAGADEIGFYAVCPLEEALRSLRASVPVSFIYGDRDWMRSRGADRVIRELGADVHVIANSGHLMYVENAEHFNSVVASILERADEEAVRL